MRTLLILLIGVCLAGMSHTTQADLIILGKGNAPIYISDEDSDRFDFNNDGLTDYYVKAHFTGRSHQTYKVDYKIQDECVKGSTYDAAKMKLGFTSTDFLFSDRVWFTDIEVWNPWFRAGSNDENKRIDLVSLPDGTLPIPFPESGDDLIVGSGKFGSFTHKDRIAELDGQPGWEGSVFFSASPGKYFLWTIHPAGGTSGCDTLVALGIPIVVRP